MFPMISMGLAKIWIFSHVRKIIVGLIYPVSVQYSISRVEVAIFFCPSGLESIFRAEGMIFLSI
jgi:hypothetical protein